MFGLGLGLGIHRHSSANPYAFPFISRVESDGGAIRDKAALLNLTYYLQSMMPNTKLLYCPELGIKLRTSGVNNYVTKLYDISSNMLDGTQTTALNQPYLSGNIAPNEKYALKNPNGGATYITHTPISFSATDKWSVSTVVSGYGNMITQYPYYAGQLSYGLGLQNGSSFEIRFVNNVSSASAPTKRYLGKNTVITWVSIGNGSLYAYINGELFQTFSGINTEYIESEIGRGRGNSLSYQNAGTVQYHCIRDIALYPTQIKDEYNYLRTLFPEIESVQIGIQTWATSNCEMTCTPQGNVIQEMQAATNVEKITNVADREFSSDTGFWSKGAGVSILDGVCKISSSSANVGVTSNMLTVGKFYKVTYTVSSLLSGSTRVFVGSGSPGIIRSNVGTYTEYLICSGDGIFRLYAVSTTANFTIDNISVEEVGWSDSANLYNYIYDNTTGTAEQKEYAAVKAAAMWCYYNNDPALGAVYGKLYNWYAVKLLQMDIDYYNAANPTNPWGWRVPASDDFTTLQTYLGGESVAGGKIKKEGLDYWNTPNTGSDNSSGFSIIPGGWKTGVGVDRSIGTSCRIWAIDRSKIEVTYISSSVSNTPESNDHNGYCLRFIKI